MKKYSVLLAFSLLHWSCTEEVSKDINTDLPQESAQFFKFSEAISEGNYLGNLTYSEYLSLTSAELPGCPSIVQVPDSRIIELVYATATECEQENKTPRTGKIILDFTLSDTEVPSWTLTYDYYTFGETQMEGIRKFEGLSGEENRENFENLRVELANQLSFLVTGTLTYSVTHTDTLVYTDSLTYYDTIPLALTTNGRMEGINPAGREFFLTITESKVQSFECYSQGWNLPPTGMESWVVARGLSTSLNYQTSFQSTGICNPVVISTLPDGRTLQLNP